jgi:hypothetical protein
MVHNNSKKYNKNVKEHNALALYSAYKTEIKILELFLKT